MLTAGDVMGGKALVQLGLVGADEVRAELEALDRDPSSAHDLLNRLCQRGRLDAHARDHLRHRVALYDHVRREAIYLRQLERRAHVGRELIARMISSLERAAFRRRLGEVLVRQGKLTAEQDRELLQRVEAWVEEEDGRILGRYRQERFAGVQKPLVPGSARLDPADFKISTLFRSKETRALVDRAELAALRAEALGLEPAAALATPAGPDEPSDTRRVPDLPPEQPVAGAALQLGQLARIEDVRRMQRICDYDVVEVLGSGGMGAVFLGQRAGLGEYVAIKVLLNQAATAAERGRFQREITLTRLVKHPNVIGIIDSGETPEGLSFLVVPALVGKELRDLLDDAGGAGLDPARVLEVMDQVLAGMEAVHAHGIVHRDLKPENVFLLAGDKLQVKVMDFGLAKLGKDAVDDYNCFRSAGGEGFCGSPAYIAPESVTDDDIDARTDIYSLGVMLFELLTGKLPLESETTQGFLTQHMICPPLTLAEARPERSWPPALEDLIARMLAKTPPERPSSCAEVRKALAAVKDELLAGGAAPAGTTEAGGAARTGPLSKRYGFKGLLGRLWQR